MILKKAFGTSKHVALYALLKERMCLKERM